MWWWEVRYRDPATGAEVVTRQRDPHPGGPAGLPGARQRRRDPQLLGAGAGRQDGHAARPHAAPAAAGRPARHLARASAPSTAASSMRAWRCTWWPSSRRPSMPGSRRRRGPRRGLAVARRQERGARGLPRAPLRRLPHGARRERARAGWARTSRTSAAGSTSAPARWPTMRPELAQLDRARAAAQARRAHALVRASASTRRRCEPSPPGWGQLK